MDAFLGFWDRVELWLVTLPFAVQLAVMLAMGAVPFLLVAALVDRVADVLVGGFRAVVDRITPSPAGVADPGEEE